jgi:hypothetical protein
MTWVRQFIIDNDNKCHYCKKELVLCSYEKYAENQFSIDRKDINKPHIKDNCVICCLKCNKYKARRTYEGYINSINDTDGMKKNKEKKKNIKKGY